ncbi:MAG: helix-turn-helix domain-containing protein [Planctomycetaceae bacterium]|jgi:excisionase family DNA binding protein|nr:helix-turn-helix domain-containing protein [Planctomycetaceae bacterium]
MMENLSPGVRIDMERTLTVKEVAARFRCSTGKVRTMVHSGRLRCIDIGGNGYHMYRFLPEEVERFLRESENPQELRRNPVHAGNRINLSDRLAALRLKKRGVLKEEMESRKETNVTKSTHKKST